MITLLYLIFHRHQHQIVKFVHAEVNFSTGLQACNNALLRFTSNHFMGGICCKCIVNTEYWKLLVFILFCVSTVRFQRRQLELHVSSFLEFFTNFPSYIFHSVRCIYILPATSTLQISCAKVTFFKKNKQRKAVKVVEIAKRGP